MLTFKEFKDQTELRNLPIREKFFRGMIFNVGQIVEDSSGRYEILNRGTNYITVVNNTGDLSKKSIDDVTLVEDRMLFESDASGTGFKGFVPGPKFCANVDAVQEFSKTIVKFSSGLIEDSIAILKAFKAVDRLFESGDSEQLDIAYASLNRIGEWESHKSYISKINKEKDAMFMSERTKIACTISESLGVKSSGASADEIINNALILSRKDLTESSKAVLSKMLVLAEGVGILYDRTILGI